MLATPAVAQLSLRAAFRFAWRALGQHVLLFAAILLSYVAAWVLLEIIVTQGRQFGLVLWAVAHIAFLAFFGGLSAGFARVCLDVRDGRSLALRQTFARLALGPVFILGQVAYLLLVSVGLLLLIVPGLYLAGRLGLFGFALIDGDAGLLGSFRRSAALTRGLGGQMAGLAGLLLLLNVAGACLLGLGLLVTVPLSTLVMADVYRQLGG